jgi:Predicted O-linked N-acetylglucosamine transferase, SPINDLY family
VIKTLPSRADCIKCLELADIYLDSYPYSDVCSLAEALLVGLPVVVRKGQTTRSRQSASVLEELLLPELVANSEKSYVELSTALGTNPELRRHYRVESSKKWRPTLNISTVALARRNSEHSLKDYCESEARRKKGNETVYGI